MYKPGSLSKKQTLTCKNRIRAYEVINSEINKNVTSEVRMELSEEKPKTRNMIKLLSKPFFKPNNVVTMSGKYD